MPNYTSPGAAATDALFKFLAEQEATKQREFMNQHLVLQDRLDQSRAEREAKRAEFDMAQAKEQAGYKKAEETQKELDRRRAEFSKRHIPTDILTDPADIEEGRQLGMLGPDGAVLPMAPKGSPVLKTPSVMITPQAGGEGGEPPLPVKPLTPQSLTPSQQPVIKFAGTAQDRQRQQAEDRLKAYIAANQGKPAGEAAAYGYATGDQGGAPLFVPPKGANLQHVGGMVNGRPVSAVFDPDTGDFLVNGQKVTNFVPTPQQGGQQPIVMYGGVPGLANRGAGTFTPLKEAGTGEPLERPETTQERNLGTAKRQIQPMLDAITELVPKINNTAGLTAKLQGGWNKVKGMANYNDDVAEYVSVVESFMPQLARAEGHTGVLTEKDFEHAMQILPKPGDSRTLAVRKLARLDKILFPKKEAAPAAEGGLVYDPATKTFKKGGD